MKLKKLEDGNHYLHSDEDKMLICPHTDGGSVVTVVQEKLQVAGNQPKVAQHIQKQPLGCGSWCALFRMSTEMDAFSCEQLCSTGNVFTATAEG